MSKLKIAVIGCGFLGSRHIKTLKQLTDQIELIGVCDTSLEAGKSIAKEYNLPYFSDYNELIGKVDAIDICTPTITHHIIGSVFLQNKIHTFIEKPISVTVKEADELIQQANNNNVKLQIGHVERFNSAFVAINEIAHNPIFIECDRLNNFPNRSLDIGVVLDLMIHDIDIIQGLIDAPIQDIQAVGVNVLTDKEDIANARITFENNCVCNVTASRVSPEVTRKIRIFQKNAYISLDYANQEAYIYRKEGMNINKESIPIEKEEPLKKELGAFIECIINDTTPVVSGVDGKNALETALRIEKIIQDNRQKTIDDRP